MMRLPTLINDRTYEPDLPETKTSSRPNRRNFLKTLGVAGVVGVGLSLAPKQLFADPAKAYFNPATNSPAAWLASCDDWRSCVQRFVRIIAAQDPDLAKWLIEQLEDSEVEAAPRYSGFHYRYAPRHAFSTKIDRREVICGNGFMVNLFPYYGVDCTCPSLFDLNAPEMARLTNAMEMEYYHCVLAPAGPRVDTEDNQRDHTLYEELRAASYKNHDPDDWSLRYKRRLVSVHTGKHYMGYGIEHKTETDNLGKSTGDVLITPYDV
jgi:hypothetical protein